MFDKFDYKMQCLHNLSSANKKKSHVTHSMLKYVILQMISEMQSWNQKRSSRNDYSDDDESTIVANDTNPALNCLVLVNVIQNTCNQYIYEDEVKVCNILTFLEMRFLNAMLAQVVICKQKNKRHVIDSMLKHFTNIRCSIV